VLSTLLDTVMGFAGTFCPHPGRKRTTVTLSLTTSFTGQCSSGTVRASARVAGGGTRVYACTGEVRGPDGTVLAVGQGTFRYRTGSEDPHGVPA
jgi:acyl-coenzyme A thioesterase PaaI-like protein